MPCHRVLAQGGLTGGLPTKRLLQRVEGHQFSEPPPTLF
ncbi:MAG: hypothetical protein ABGY72_20030 [bacterium]